MILNGLQILAYVVWDEPASPYDFHSIDNGKRKKKNCAERKYFYLKIISSI